jgi:hypothetical protein
VTAIRNHLMSPQISLVTSFLLLHIDPLKVAFRLWTVSGDIKAGERIFFRARQQINLMKVKV